jgi:hypothetical protein
MSATPTPLVLTPAKRSHRMEALIKVFERLENSVERRIWLLYEALRFVPLDEAKPFRTNPFFLDRFLTL